MIISAASGSFGRFWTNNSNFGPRYWLQCAKWVGIPQWWCSSSRLTFTLKSMRDIGRLLSSGRAAVSEGATPRQSLLWGESSQPLVFLSKLIHIPSVLLIARCCSEFNSIVTNDLSKSTGMPDCSWTLTTPCFVCLVALPKRVERPKRMGSYWRFQMEEIYLKPSMIYFHNVKDPESTSINVKFEWQVHVPRLDLAFSPTPQCLNLMLGGLEFIRHSLFYRMWFDSYQSEFGPECIFRHPGLSKWRRSWKSPKCLAIF